MPDINAVVASLKGSSRLEAVQSPEGGSRNENQKQNQTENQNEKPKSDTESDSESRQPTDEYKNNRSRRVPIRSWISLFKDDGLSWCACHDGWCNGHLSNPTQPTDEIDQH